MTIKTTVKIKNSINEGRFLLSSVMRMAAFIDADNVNAAPPAQPKDLIRLLIPQKPSTAKLIMQKTAITISLIFISKTMRSSINITANTADNTNITMGEIDFLFC